MFGRRRLPAELRPPMDRDERVLAWARLAEGAAVVATNRGLHIPGYELPGHEPPEDELPGYEQPGYESPRAAAEAGDRPGGGFLGWHEIHKAAWTGERLTITPGAVVERRDGYLVTADQPPVTVAVPDPGDLPHAVRGRVTRSVSFSSHHLVPGGGVRVVARRVPGIDGLSWAVRYDRGTDPHGPGVVDATDHLVGAARGEVDPVREDPGIR